MFDYDHLRGEVCVRFSAPPSDDADQNPHDGCHCLHHHRHDSGHLYDLPSQGIDTVAVVFFPLSYSAFDVWSGTVDHVSRNVIFLRN